MTKVSSATSSTSNKAYVPPKENEDNKKKTESKNTQNKPVDKKTVSPYPANSGTNSNDNKIKTDATSSRKTVSPFNSKPTTANTGVSLLKKTDDTKGSPSDSTSTSTKTAPKSDNSTTTKTDLTSKKDGITVGTDTKTVSLKQTTGTEGSDTTTDTAVSGKEGTKVGNGNTTETDLTSKKDGMTVGTDTKTVSLKQTTGTEGSDTTTDTTVSGKDGTKVGNGNTTETDLTSKKDGMTVGTDTKNVSLKQTTGTEGSDTTTDTAVSGKEGTKVGNGNTTETDLTSKKDGMTVGTDTKNVSLKQTTGTEGSDKTDNTEASDKTDDTEASDKTDDTEASDKTDDTEASDKTDDTEESDKTDDTEASDKTDDTEASDKTDDTEASDKTDDTEASDKTDDTEASDKTDDTEASDKTDDTEASDKTDDTEESDKTDDTEASDKTDDTEASDKTDDTEASDKTDDTEASDKTDDTEASDKTDDTEASDKTDDTEASDKTDDTEASDKTDDTEASDKTDDTEESDKTDDTEASDKTDDTEASDKTDDTEASDKTDDTEASDKTDDTEASDKTDDTDAMSSTADDVNDEEVIGYDEDGNPITKSEYTAPENKLAEQKVDETEANSELTNIFNQINENDKVGNEVVNYLNDKYKDNERITDGTDIYENPQNYTAEQKLVQYVDLLNLSAQWNQYKDYMSTPHTGTGGTIKNEKEIDADIQGAIDTLLQDPSMSSLLTSEYLTGVGKILNGEKFSDNEDFYDDAYTQSLNELRTGLETRYDEQMTQGRAIWDAGTKGLNEATTLAKFNTNMTAYTALLSEDFLNSRADQTQEIYDAYYNSNVLPLTPEAPEALRDLTYNLNTASLSPDELKRVGMATPTVNGQDYVDMVGTNLSTERLSQQYRGMTSDEATAQQIKDLGLEGKVENDAFNGSYIPTISNITNQVFGENSKASPEKTQFAETLMNELTPMIDKINEGMTTTELNKYLQSVETKLGKGEMGDYSQQIATALNGVARGSSLTDSLLLVGLGNYTREDTETGVGIQGKDVSLQDLQVSLGIATGYEGRGLSKAEGEAGELASTVFGTENRAWESGLVERFGSDIVQKYSDNMVEQMRATLPGADVSNTTMDLFGYTKAVEEKLGKPLTDAIGQSLYADNPEALKQYETKIPNLMHNIWSLAKPGGSTDKFLKQVQDLVSVEGGAFSDGSVSLSEQKKTFSKWTTSFLAGTRALSTGAFANTSDPNAIAGIALHSTTAAGQVLGLVDHHLVASSMDARTLVKIGEYGDAAIKATKTFAGTAGTSLGALADIAWLPADISSFVSGMKNGSYDTAEKVFQSFILGSDVGVAVDGAISLARAVIPSSVLAGSRFASIFTGVGGATMSAIGAAFNVINAFALIGINIYQNIKEQNRADKLTSEMDNNAWRLVRDSVSQHLGPWPNNGTPWITPEEEARIKESMMYTQEVTQTDWGAIQANNRRRNEEAQQQSNAA